MKPLRSHRFVVPARGTTKVLEPLRGVTHLQHGHQSQLCQGSTYWRESVLELWHCSGNRGGNTVIPSTRCDAKPMTVFEIHQ